MAARSRGAAAGLLERLKGVKSSGDGWVALCPSHGDRDPSLSVSIGRDGRTLVKCFAGCSTDGILAAAGLDWQALFPDRRLARPATVAKKVPALKKRAAQPPAKKKGWTPSKEPPTTLRHPKLGTPANAWPLRDTEGRPFAVHARFEPGGKKTLRWWRDGRWSLKTAGLGSADAPLYGSERLASWDRSRPVFVVEGEKAADALLAIGTRALASVTGASRVPDWAALEPLKGRPSVVVWPDKDEAGEKHMYRLAGCLVSLQSIDACDPASAPLFEPVRTFKPEGLPPGGDAVEWIEAQRAQERTDEKIRDDLEAGIEDLPTWEPPPEKVAGVEPEIWTALCDAEEIEAVEPALRALAAALAGSDDIAKGVAREKAVQILKGKGFKRPAALVDATLKASSSADTGGAMQGQALRLVEPEPWPEAVDGAQLLVKLAQAFTRYVALPEGSATALALWAVHAHAHEAAWVSPILAVTSPEKRCSKTRVLTLLEALTPRALLAANITPATPFRAVEDMKPTLLIDEADTFLRGREELRGILNSGHTRRAAFVLRTVGDDHEPRRFSTWWPKAIAMIGDLPDTLEDRSIPVPIRRKTPDETVATLRLDRTGDPEELSRKVARWVDDHLDALGSEDHEAPKELHDHAADNWRPLLAIADMAGGPWPEQARQAALVLAAEQEDENASIGIRLLTYLRAIFRRSARDRLFTDQLLEELHKLEESPWREFGKMKKPLSAIGLARLLKRYKVRPRDIRIGPDHRKGYLLGSLTDAFRRYLPSEPRQPRQASNDGALQPPPSRDTAPAVADMVEPESRE